MKRIFIICMLTKHWPDDQVKEDNRGREYNGHGRENKGTQNFGRKETNWNRWPKIENNIKMDQKETELSPWIGIHIFLNSDQYLRLW